MLAPSGRGAPGAFGFSVGSNASPRRVVDGGGAVSIDAGGAIGAAAMTGDGGEYCGRGDIGEAAEGIGAAATAGGIAAAGGGEY